MKHSLVEDTIGQSKSSDYQLEYIEEPKLCFGYGQETENPKDGLFLFGPVDDKANPAEMRVGVVGTRSGLTRYAAWVSSIQRYIPPKAMDRGHHAGWPGFQAVFGARWPTESLVTLRVDDKAAHDTIRLRDPHEAVYKTVGLFAEPIRQHLRESETPPSIWFVVIPEDLYRYGRPQSSVPTDERVPGTQYLDHRTGRRILSEGSIFPGDIEAAQVYRYERNFHHQMKARLLDDKAVVQIVRETTLDQQEGGTAARRSLEDPATVAWNLCTTAFFKASGRPWKQARVRTGVCYVGLVFKRVETDPGSGNACCGAQMFLDSGDGLVFRGAVGPWYSDERKEFHLNRDKAAELTSLVMESYRNNHGDTPTELFIHGRKRFEDAEWEGFQCAVPEGTNLVGVRITPSKGLKLVFISFDYDHDRDLHGNLVAQAKRPDSPFTIVDHSLPSAVHDESWKRQARLRIRQADVVVFICGVNTHSARGVEAEMSITHSEGKRYFLLKGRRDHPCSKPGNARRSDAIHPWTWPKLKNLLRHP